MSAFGAAYVLARLLFGSLPDRLGGARVAALSAVPTAKEYGLTDLDCNSWSAFFLPRGAPPEIEAKLAEFSGAPHVIACAKAGKQPQLFVQVNIGDEEQKGGCAVSDLPALLAEARDAGLRIDGLMAIPPATQEPAPYFALLDELAERHGLPLRSMGMSGDYEIAVMLGATHVRVGTALFGAR